MTRSALAKLQDELRAGWTSRRPHRWSRPWPAHDGASTRCLRTSCVQVWLEGCAEPVGCVGSEPGPG